MPYGFVIDQNRCIGCHACTVACKSENDVPVGDFRTWVKYTEIGSFPQAKRHFAVLRCNHCTSAPCVTICPVTALNKRPDGIVDLNRDVCIGCKSCMQACPYDALYINEESGSAEKCHYCAHRVDVGLEPACVTVCPEQAIIAGDFSDPESRIGQAMRQPDAKVRRPEQNTGPNVWYLGADEVSLDPGAAAEPDQYLWSERRVPPPDYPSDLQEVVPKARTVLDVNHKTHWGWRVDAYLVTKGIAAGAMMLAPAISAQGSNYWPEILGLVFLTATLFLLVIDLKRPQLFFTILTRPNWSSWLVKGSIVLTAFGGLCTAGLALRFLGMEAAADLVRWINIPAAIMTAGYTAFLFGQCEGRDLWQGGWRLFAHLLAQAFLLGGAALYCATQHAPLVWPMLLGGLLHLALTWHEMRMHHETRNARLAASLLPRIPAWPGAKLMALPLGLGLSTTAAVLLTVLGLSGAGLLLALPATLALTAGIWLYERAFVRAGQLPPLS